MTKINSRWGFIAVLACSLPFSALAQQAAPHDVNDNHFGAAADVGALNNLRGGSEITRTDMTLSGTTSNNTTNQVVTGSNVITAGSFANMSGIPLVVQNSGANVLIQNAIIVNVKME